MMVKHFLLLLLPMQLFAQVHPIIFKNVNIVDVKKGTIIKNQNILIEGNRIKKISAGSVVADSAIIIDASGKYMMPGLCDFNAEVFNYEYAGSAAFNLLLANGVTSVRDLKPEQKIADVFATTNRL